MKQNTKVISREWQLADLYHEIGKLIFGEDPAGAEKKESDTGRSEDPKMRFSRIRITISLTP